MSRANWYEHGVPCKIGTVPMVAQLRKSDVGMLTVGRWIRVKLDRGGKWEWVRLTRVDTDGYFMADR